MQKRIKRIFPRYMWKIAVSTAVFVLLFGISTCYYSSRQMEQDLENNLNYCLSYFNSFFDGMAYANYSLVLDPTVSGVMASPLTVDPYDYKTTLDSCKKLQAQLSSAAGLGGEPAHGRDLPFLPQSGKHHSGPRGDEIFVLPAAGAVAHNQVRLGGGADFLHNLPQADVLVEVVGADPAAVQPKHVDFPVMGAELAELLVNELHVLHPQLRVFVNVIVHVAGGGLAELRAPIVGAVPVRRRSPCRCRRPQWAFHKRWRPKYPGRNESCPSGTHSRW